MASAILKLRYKIINSLGSNRFHLNRLSSNSKLLIIPLLITLFYFTLVYPSRPLLIKDPNLKYIQLYTGVFDYKDWDQAGLGQIPFKGCPESRCVAVKPYITQTAMEDADGVMVHGPNLWYLPNRNSYKRNRKQIWLYYALESPRGSMCSSHYKAKDLDDWFNLTATYKLDSDFVSGYSPVDRLEDMEKLENYQMGFLKHVAPFDYMNSEINWIEFIMKEKRRKAPIVWFVSHCETASRREKYVKELQKYIDIDIYGKCTSHFTNSLPDPCPKGSEPDCFKKLMNSYKFYLSFENSLCDDYISEKYWKLYNHEMLFEVNLLPVTRGATDEQFKKVVFNNSLVNAYNYESPRQLASYLNKLSRNDTEYLEYFNWKKILFKNMDLKIKLLKDKAEFGGKSSEDKSLFLKSKSRSPFCYLCRQLHNESYIQNVDESNRVWKLSEWFGWKSSCWDEDEERRVPFWFTQYLGFCF